MGLPFFGLIAPLGDCTIPFSFSAGYAGNSPLAAILWTFALDVFG